ncbi:MAG: hypothetical protein ABJA34_10345 [Pseudonocardiales bacterium]
MPALLADGHTVRCLSREATRLRDVPWHDHVEVSEGDVLDRIAVCTEHDIATVVPDPPTDCWGSTTRHGWR